jgi:putative endonuclease
MSWYVYILKCADSTLYSGITNDLEQRLKAHNAKKGAKYTASRLPVTLVWQEAVTDKSTALKREYELKKLSRAEKLKLIA